MNSEDQTILRIEQTEDSPEILIDLREGVFRMTGSSYPENAFEVYDPVLQWLEQFNQKGIETPLRCTFDFNIISSASHKMLYELLIKLEELHKIKPSVLVCWRYEPADNDMYEIGEDFSETLSLPFEFEAK